MGIALAKTGRMQGAIDNFEKALKLILTMPWHIMT